MYKGRQKSQVFTFKTLYTLDKKKSVSKKCGLKKILGPQDLSQQGLGPKKLSKSLGPKK